MNNLHPNRFHDAARAGFRVFSLLPSGKKPAVAWTEYTEREPTEAELADWDASEYNVGVITGNSSNLAVLDVDNAEAQLFVDSLGLPATPFVRTGKGIHYYFQAPPGGIGNRAGIAGHKLDLRGDGGYVVGPGSVHESGRVYEWVASPEDVPFAPFPQKLLDLLEVKKSRSTLGVDRSAESFRLGESRFDSWLRQALRDATAAVAKAEAGTRNDNLFRAGVQLARDVAGADADWSHFAAALRDAALQIDLEDAEIHATLASCWKSGATEPTRWMVTAREWVYLSKPDVFYHPESGEDLTVKAFNNTFASQRVESGTFHSFLLNGEFVRSFQDLTFSPTSEQVVERDGLQFFNIYRPSTVVAVEGDWTPFEEFLRYLVPDEAERSHLLKMIAWTIRFPGRKLRHALLFRSEAQGIGKSMLTEIWGALLGQSNVRKTTTEEMLGQFQGFIKGSLLVVLEELGRGVGPSEYNRLKDIITADISPVNEKYKPVKNWPNLASFVILTNVRKPIIMEEQDRRFFYIDSPASRQSPNYYAGFARWWGENLGVIRAFLDTIDLTEFKPHAPPPMTASKEALIADGRDPLTRELAHAIECREGVFGRDLVTLAEVQSELGRTLRGPSKADVLDAMKAYGAVPLNQQRVTGEWQYRLFVPKQGRVSLWAVRNAEYWTVVDGQRRADEYARGEGLLAFVHGFPIGVRHISELPALPHSCGGSEA